MGPSLPRTVLTSVATVLLSLPVAAQSPTLICVTPPEPNAPGRCSIRATASPGQHSVTVQIRDAEWVAGTPIKFTVEEPGRTIEQSKTADADGKATFEWFGAAGTGVSVKASAEVSGRTLTRMIDVQAPATATTQRNVVLVSDSLVFGYESRQIQGPVKLRIENFGERCESNVVVFRPYGTAGLGSPDSVRATSDPVLGGVAPRARGGGWVTWWAGSTCEPPSRTSPRRAFR